MAIDERRRAEAYQRLEAVIGPEAATTIFEHLPPVGWADVATKHDLDQHRAATKQDLDQHRAATKQDLDQHRAATKQDLDAFRREIRQEMEALEHKLTATFRGELVAQTRTIVFTMMGTVLGTVFGMGGFMLAAADRLAGA